MNWVEHVNNLFHFLGFILFSHAAVQPWNMCSTSDLDACI